MKDGRVANTMSLTKVVLGTTLVSYPKMFKDYGIIPMVLAIILIGGVLCSTSLYFLYVASAAVQAETYEELGERTIGKNTKRTIKISIFLIGYFSLVIYIQLCSELLRIFIDCGDITSKIYSGLICGFLSTFSSSIGKLKIINLIGLFSIGILLVTIFGQFIKNYKGLEDINFTPASSGLFGKFGFISLCFCSHFVIIPFMNNLEPNKEEQEEDPVESNYDGAYKNYQAFTKEFQKKKKNLSIIFASSTLSVLVYLFVGIFGYLAFPETDENWARNPFGNRTISLFLSLLLISVIVLSYPLCVVASKDILKDITPDSLQNMPGLDTLLVWILTFTSCLIAIKKKLDFMNNLFLTFGSLVMFIYPTIFYFKLVRPLKKFTLFLGVFTMGGGLVMMCMSIKTLLTKE